MVGCRQKETIAPTNSSKRGPNQTPPFVGPTYLSHHQVLLVLLVCCDFRLVLCQQVTIYIGKILWSAHDLLLCYCADNLLC